MPIIGDADDENRDENEDVQGFEKNYVVWKRWIDRPDPGKKIRIEKWILRLRWRGG